MRSRILGVLLGLAMGWTVGCTTLCTSHTPTTAQPAKPPRTAALETRGRWIGLLAGGAKGSTCPTVPGWKTQNLLELAAAQAEDGSKRYGYAASPEAIQANSKGKEKLDTLFHKHGLDRFCVYTAQSEGRDFRKPAGLARAEPDRMGLTASAPPDLDPLGTQIWERLADQFVARAGTVRFNDVPNPTVRLVFVDSHPTGEGVPAPSPAPVSWHGYGMAHLANEMVCGPAQSCPIHLATRLALRYDDYDADPYSGDDSGNDAGGHQGRIGDLAAAITAELDHWQQHYADTKLILNLSIGWDGEYHELDANKEGKLDLATQAVVDALKAAHDAGVLVIAAAGNRTGGENSQQPLLPAAWELHPPAGVGNLSGQKLAYAMGGVDWQDLPLPNARPLGMPQLVAYADHAVARTSDGTPTKVYTGSSVAAVVASASAAVTWHLRPNWTPADVMAQLKQGIALQSTATYYPSGGSAPALQRLSLRKILPDLCGEDAGCPGVVAPSPVTESLVSSPADLSAITSQISSTILLNPVNPPFTCDSQTQVYMASDPPSDLPFSDPRGCPMETLPDMNAPALTQTLPPDTPCPTCAIGPGSSGGTASAGAAPQRVASLNNPWLGLDAEVNAARPYSLATAIDPDWLANQNGATIDSAILVIDCKTEPQLKERLDLTAQFQALLDASQPESTLPPPVQSISFGGVSGQRSIAGCTASVDFTLSVMDSNGDTSQRSVQSPVYVDP